MTSGTSIFWESNGPKRDSIGAVTTSSDPLPDDVETLKAALVAALVPGITNG